MEEKEENDYKKMLRVWGDICRRLGSDGVKIAGTSRIDPNSVSAALQNLIDTSASKPRILVPGTDIRLLHGGSIETEELGEAIDFTLKLLKDPDLVDSYFWELRLGDLYYAQGQHKRAVELFVRLADSCRKNGQLCKSVIIIESIIDILLPKHHFELMKEYAGIDQWQACRKHAMALLRYWEKNIGQEQNPLIIQRLIETRMFAKFGLDNMAEEHLRSIFGSTAVKDRAEFEKILEDL